MDEWWCYGVIGEEKGEVISREVVPHFQKRHNLIENKAQEIINILSHPKEKAVFNLEREDFLNLCLIILENKYLLDLLPDRKIEEIMKNKRMSKYVQKYLDDYFWFETNFYRVKKITLEDVFEKISTEIGLKSEERIKRELKAIKENFEKIEKSKKDLLNKMELTDEDGKDIYFVKRTVYWIDQRKLGMMKHLFYLFSFFEDVAKIKNIGYEELSFYLANELEELFLSDKRLSKEEIDKRKKGVFMAFVKNVEPKLFFGKDLEKFVIIVKNKNKKNSIKGVVTSMTRVEFVPMMRVARAVITNEGGIACHAAIVARELGIPAIIGTKIVTDVLKNGDGVEMNMKTGEVKILDG